MRQREIFQNYYSAHVIMMEEAKQMKAPEMTNMIECGVL